MKATELKIKLLGQPVLRKRAAYVRHVTQTQRDILSSMARLMYAQQGIGLAATQVGVSEAMIVVDIGSGLYKLVNPKIIYRRGSQVMEEGCLSIPGISVKVKRAKKIIVKAEDENAKPLNIEAEDLFACVLQHEIDHLRGRLITDYASFFEKLALKKRLEEIQRKAKDEELSESEGESCKLQL